MGLLPAVFLPLGSAGPEAGLSHPLQDSERARRVVDQALQAYGGPEHLKAVSSITMKGIGQGHSSAESQGYVDGRRSDEDYKETLVAFPAQEKLAFEHRTDNGERTVRWRRWLYRGDEREVGDFTVQAKYTRRNATFLAERIQQARRIPHVLVLEASKNPSALRIVSDSSIYAGRRHEVIAYRPPDEKTTLNLFLDNQTHLLSKVEYQMDFPAMGDVLVEYIYSDYRRDERLGWVPSHHAIKVAGNSSLEVKVEMAADTREAVEIFQLPEFPPNTTEEKFQLPEHLRKLVGPPDTTVEAASGVYLVEISGFTVMFVEFKDFILVAEAPAIHPTLTRIPADSQPGSAVLAEEFIQKIKQKIPNKPLKYLAVTHYHSDHAGGARAFMAEGATILTTPGNKRFFERLAAAPHSLVPDRLSRSPRPLSIETFSQKTISDGIRTVELIDIGPNPHSMESLVVFIPQEKILFQGDLFYFDLGATFPQKNRIEIMSFLAKWLKDHGLAPERIYSVHSHGFATMEHVNKVLEMSRGKRPD